MSFPTAEPKQEIIIVRRGGEQEEGHHGGVWKIAFADFMTAMMCFFLVMWLINAANEQTKASVASYFNPVRLIDRNSSRKGLEDIGDGPNSVGASDESPENADGQAKTDGQARGGPKDETNSADTADKVTFSDEHLFADPYAVLAEIVKETGQLANVSAKGDGGAQDSGPATGASGGESYRDPFAPDFWSQQVAGNETAEGSSGGEVERFEADGTDDAGVKGIEVAPLLAEKVEPEKVEPAERAEVKHPETAPIPEPRPAEAAKPTETSEAGEPAEAKMPELVGAAPAAETPPPPVPEVKGPSEEAIREAETIKQELAKVFEANDKVLEGLSVVPTETGVSISVTDQLDFGMFEIGSAMPRREMILAMEKIAKVLEGRKGNLSIEGHTDARPFKSAAYDNWRLSTARAHAAYYMLVRGGIEEKRIAEVGGMADRKPKIAEDPLAAANRRIEILLEIEG
jgi:chemotaxis protein MotB